MIVEVNDAGEILVPAELVQAAPHTRINADREGDSVVLKPLAEKPREMGEPSGASRIPRLDDTAGRRRTAADAWRPFSGRPPVRSRIRNCR